MLPLSANTLSDFQSCLKISLISIVLLINSFTYDMRSKLANFLTAILDIVLLKKDFQRLVNSLLSFQALKTPQKSFLRWILLKMVLSNRLDIASLLTYTYQDRQIRPLSSFADWTDKEKRECRRHNNTSSF